MDSRMRITPVCSARPCRRAPASSTTAGLTVLLSGLELLSHCSVLYASICRRTSPKDSGSQPRQRLPLFLVSTACFEKHPRSLTGTKAIIIGVTIYGDFMSGHFILLPRRLSALGFSQCFHAPPFCWRDQRLCVQCAREGRASSTHSVGASHMRNPGTG
jgi:hypothetical protein